jgi:SAM-dependent methyltransferase
MPPGAETIVDVGAFPGHLTRELARHWQVVALDIEPDRPVDAQDAFHFDLSPSGRSFSEEMKAVGVQALKVDIEQERWPLDSAFADAVVMTEVIEHLYLNPLHTLLEINRILRSGGLLLLSTPNLLSIRNRANFALGRMDRVIQPPALAFLQRHRLGHHGHVRLYSYSELERMVGMVGFRSNPHFFSFVFTDGDGSANDPERTLQTRSARRFLKSPRGYVMASLATGSAILERLIPSFRKHMYLICKKERHISEADLRALRVAA